MTLEARPWLDRISPYVPGKQAVDADASMASNESAVGASPRVAEAVRAAADSLHRYPDPLADELRHELARQHGVDPDQILVGNGSDEIIFLLAWAYLAHGGTAICADPPYRIDEISALVTGADVASVPLVDWRHDLDAMAGLPGQIAYVVNPHNPTGTTRTLADIERFVETSRADLVVVDEAYIDFVDDPGAMTAMPLARDGRAAVLRTFSKAHGLAGLRIGYLVASSDIIATLRKIRAPFSVSGVAQAGAVAAARDGGHRDLVRLHTITYRSELVEVLEGAGLTVVPSQANFVLVETADEAGLVARLAEHGISTRAGTALGLPGTVRISVPTARGVDLLREALAPTPTR